MSIAILYLCDHKPSSYNQETLTLLFYAYLSLLLFKLNMVFFRWLFARGADPNISTGWANDMALFKMATPLFVALLSGDPLIVQLLIDIGAQLYDPKTKEIINFSGRQQPMYLTSCFFMLIYILFLTLHTVYQL